MQSRPPLPPQLGSRPFTVESSRSAGLDHNRLRRIDVVHVSRGLYRPSAWNFHLEDAARALSEATPGAWISHVTAARLLGSLLPSWLSDSNELHLSKRTALPGTRRKGIHGHRVIVRPGEVAFVDGIWLSTRARTWLDMARQLPLGDLVAMGDELVRQPRLDFEDRDSPHSTIGELRALITRHPNLQGVVRARQALELVRVGSDSAPETFLRLAMMDSNLPAPELQLKLRPGDPRSPSADLGYGRQRIAIQYDGGHHVLEPQRISDRRRDRSFEAAGWTVVIIDKADQEDNFAAAIKKIRRALRSSLSESTVTAGFVSSC